MHAAACIAVAVYPADAVTMTRGDVQPRMLKITRHMACHTCGGHAFSERADLGLRSVNAFLLPPGVFQPQMHLYCRHAVLPVVDDLPHYQTFPAVFGGSDDLVDWRLPAQSLLFIHPEHAGKRRCPEGEFRPSS